jgi:hypothetical protein
MAYQYATRLELFTTVHYTCHETILTCYCHLQERKYSRQQQPVNKYLYQGGSPAKFLEVSTQTYLTKNQFSYQFPIGSPQSDNSWLIYAQI